MEPDSNEPLGLCFDLKNSQLCYEAVGYSNAFVSKNIIPISGFFVESHTPCIKPAFACYNIADIVIFDGIIIASSLKMLSMTEKSRSKGRILYMYDLEVQRDWCDKKYFYDVMNDPAVYKVCRSNSHQNFLSNIGYTVNAVIKQFNPLDIYRSYKECMNAKKVS